mmetsp:Transcript_13279/g.40774  ORF Transcript_13279/g.40774 Transcript_13279/m.40774 type:complete len:134 (+) Transcript_13279:162-563(+)
MKRTKRQSGIKRPALKDVDENSLQDHGGHSVRGRGKRKDQSFLPVGGRLQERLKGLLSPDAQDVAIAALHLTEEEKKSLFPNAEQAPNEITSDDDAERSTSGKRRRTNDSDEADEEQEEEGSDDVWVFGPKKS